MNILLTGGAGYIGSHAALSLIDKGHSVTIIDNLITGTKRLIPKKAKYHEPKHSTLITHHALKNYI